MCFVTTIEVSSSHQCTPQRILDVLIFVNDGGGQDRGLRQGLSPDLPMNEN